MRGGVMQLLGRHRWMEAGCEGGTGTRATPETAPSEAARPGPELDTPGAPAAAVAAAVAAAARGAARMAPAAACALGAPAVPTASPGGASSPVACRRESAGGLFLRGLLPGLAAALAAACRLRSAAEPLLCERLAFSSALAAAGFAACARLIPPFAEKLAAQGLAGVDLNKEWRGASQAAAQPEGRACVPESLGLVVAMTFILCAALSQLLFSHEATKLLEYNAGLLTLAFISFLGFVDDVLNLRWRYKLLLPIAAALPLVIAYQGSTSVLIPPWLAPYVLGRRLVDLGVMYRVYMVLLTVFCTNAVNIYAGINGLEVGQSLVIAFFVVGEALYTLRKNAAAISALKVIATGTFEGPEAGLLANAVLRDQVLMQNEHRLFSILLSLPFIGCSMALFHYNRFPATVFVGDTYTYFAGAFFAVVGILGHFSKTLLLFFIPQLLNFVLSVPQLCGIIPCPRHRLPLLNQYTGKLEPSYNFTLINAFLYVFGPMNEGKLCKCLLTFQAMCCAVGLVIREVLFPCLPIPHATAS